METILVFLALIVASITLFIQRQHNRKELLPILATEYEQVNNNGEQLYQLWLVNNGHGVAIIKSIKLHLSTGEIITLSDNYSFLHVIDQYVPTRIKMSNSLPKSISACNKEKLYSFVIPAKDSNGLMGSTVTIVAESVYGDIVTVNRDGFDVTSNPRDAICESILKLPVDAIIRINDRRN